MAPPNRKKSRSKGEPPNQKTSNPKMQAILTRAPVAALKREVARREAAKKAAAKKSPQGRADKGKTQGVLTLGHSNVAKKKK